MLLFAPNSVIRAADHNANNNELKAKTDLLAVPDTTWREIGATNQPAFLNGWLNYDVTYNSAAFRKDALGYVHLKGLVRSGGVGSDIFVLPVGYRPALRAIFAGLNASNNAVGRIDVLPTGNISPQLTSNSWVSLEGITFKAEL